MNTCFLNTVYVLDVHSSLGTDCLSVDTNWDSEKDSDNIVKDKTQLHDEVTLLKYFIILTLKVVYLIFVLVSFSSQKDHL